MKNGICFFIVALLAIGNAGAQESDDEPAERQKVSLGALAGVNASGIRASLPGGEFGAQAGVAGEVALFTEYHINRLWGTRLTVAPAVERTSWAMGQAARSTTTTGVLDIVLGATLRLPAGQNFWILGLGPYSRFVVGGSTSGTGPWPYALQVGQDSITGEPRYAVDKFGSGFAAFVGFENRRGLMVQAEVRVGLTNILNTEAYRGRLWPYKAVLGVGRRF